MLKPYFKGMYSSSDGKTFEIGEMFYRSCLSDDLVHVFGM